MTEGPETIIEFWFGTELDDAAAARQQSPLWWAKRDETDALIRQRFENFVMSAGTGALQDWAATAIGRLALIILTDQFTRNIYRDTPAAFGFDERARELCLTGLERGDDRQLRAIQRVFFYLPLEHSENVEHQRLSVSLFNGLAAEASTGLQSLFAGFADYAVRHQVIIERFGRFPHRNALLGRTSTPEEVEFLKQPGSSF
ncbi:MAG: DUF924 family protein [Gammaproteobacteria bacterium]|nr:DUF924 family protein [Gammaproteobacteria bacterium]MDP2141997.1 DUF924 family protein [Gammaproteobacteria bacterium]MDP2348424.1 DUF924 family protein [Gammaproteobacteria bacterium]